MVHRFLFIISIICVTVTMCVLRCTVYTPIFLHINRKSNQSNAQTHRTCMGRDFFYKWIFMRSICMWAYGFFCMWVSYIPVVHTYYAFMEWFMDSHDIARDLIRFNIGHIHLSTDPDVQCTRWFSNEKWKKKK